MIVEFIDEILRIDILVIDPFAMELLYTYHQGGQVSAQERNSGEDATITLVSFGSG